MSSFRIMQKSMGKALMLFFPGAIVSTAVHSWVVAILLWIVVAIGVVFWLKGADDMVKVYIAVNTESRKVVGVSPTPAQAASMADEAERNGVRSDVIATARLSDSEARKLGFKR